MIGRTVSLQIERREIRPHKYLRQSRSSYHRILFSTCHQNDPAENHVYAGGNEGGSDEDEHGLHDIKTDVAGDGRRVSAEGKAEKFNLLH